MKWTLAAVAVLGAGAATLALRPSAVPASAATPRASAAKIALGKPVAPFALPDPASGRSVTVGAWKERKATVLMFIATKCPVSNAYNARMARLAKTYAPQGVQFYGINSNQAEGGAEIVAHSKQNGFSFPVLKDAGNKIADRFEAQVTPEVYVVGANGNLLYHGNIDNSKDESEVKSRSLQSALDAIVAGKPVAAAETRAFGCSIKRAN